MLKEYKHLLAFEERRLKELSKKPYNSATRDCENLIMKYKEKIKELELMND